MFIDDVMKAINLSYLFSVLLGAGISVVITHYLTKKRERIKLMKELQIKAAEEILTSTLKIREEAFIFLGYNRKLQIMFNILLEAHANENANSYMEEFPTKNKLGEIKKHLVELSSTLRYSFSSFESSFQVRQIIIEEVSDHVYSIYKSSKMLIESTKWVYDIDINKKVIKGDIPIFLKQINDLNRAIIHITNEVHNFNKILQNTYYSELFNRTVPVMQDLNAVNTLAEQYYGEDRFFEQT